MIKKIDRTISVYAIRDANSDTYLSNRGWVKLAENKIRVFNQKNHATSAIHQYMREQGRNPTVVEFQYVLTMIVHPGTVVEHRSFTS